jgi:hypothetical protein
VDQSIFQRLTRRGRRQAGLLRAFQPIGCAKQYHLADQRISKGKNLHIYLSYKNMEFSSFTE